MPPSTTDAPDDDGDVASVEQEIGQIARGAGVGLGGNVVYYAVSYLFGILVARQIGAESFGLYTLGSTATTLVTRFTVFGLDRGLMRFASISRGEKSGGTLRRLVILALSMGTVAGLLGASLFWIAPKSVLTFLRWTDKPELAPLLRAFAIAIPTMTITGIAIAGTQAFRTMRYRALVVNVVQPLVRLTIALGLIAVVGATAMAPTLGFVAAQVVGALLALFFLWRLVRSVSEQGSILPGTGRQLTRFSVPLMAVNVFEYLNGRTEILVLGIFLAADAVGIFNAASRLAGLGLIVLTAFNAIFSPVISDLHHRGELKRLDVLYKLVTRWVVLAAMPILVIQLIFAPN